MAAAAVIEANISIHSRAIVTCAGLEVNPRIRRYRRIRFRAWRQLFVDEENAQMGMPGILELLIIGGMSLLLVGLPITIALVVVACLRKRDSNQP
jgi:hypothetical protein